MGVLTQGTWVNLDIASGYEMNAKPVPPPAASTWLGGTPITKARLPRIPNMVTPDSNDVKVSNVVTTSASLNTINDKRKRKYVSLYETYSKSKGLLVIKKYIRHLVRFSTKSLFTSKHCS